MTLHLISSNPHPRPANNALAPGAQHLRDVAHALIAMGSELARLVHQQAKAPAGTMAPRSIVDLARDFSCAARAVRYGIALGHRLGATRDPAELRMTTRHDVLQAIEDAIQRNAGVTDAEFIDRDDGPDLEDEIGDRPAIEILAEACRDLALATPPGMHSWQLPAPNDIIALCAAAGWSHPASADQAAAPE